MLTLTLPFIKASIRYSVNRGPQARRAQGKWRVGNFLLVLGVAKSRDHSYLPPHPTPLVLPPPPPTRSRLGPEGKIRSPRPQQSALGLAAKASQPSSAPRRWGRRKGWGPGGGGDPTLQSITVKSFPK